MPIVISNAVTTAGLHILQNTAGLQILQNTAELYILQTTAGRDILQMSHISYKRVYD